MFLPPTRVCVFSTRQRLACRQVDARLPGGHGRGRGRGQCFLLSVGVGIYCVSQVQVPARRGEGLVDESA